MGLFKIIASEKKKSLFIQNLVIILLPLFTLVPFLLRLIVNFSITDMYFNDEEYSHLYPLLSAFASDLLIVGALLLLSAAIIFFQRTFVLILASIFYGLILCLIFIDVMVFYTFNMRLSYEQVLEYGKYISFIWDYVPSLLAPNLAFPFIFLMGMILMNVYLYKVGSAKKRQYISATYTVIAIVCIISSQFSNPEYDTEFNNNTIVSFINSAKTTLYSDEFIQNFDYEPVLTCHEGLNKQPNIILLIVESYSAYQSKYLLGERDWTPHLDKLIQEHTFVPQFMGNHYNSIKALESIFSGTLSLPETSIPKKWNRLLYNPSLIRDLNDSGYETAFLTPSTLAFSQKGLFAKNLGFQYYEGINGEFYKDHQKMMQFYASTDSALYLRSLSLMTGQEHYPQQKLHDMIPSKRDDVDGTLFKHEDEKYHKNIHNFPPSPPLPQKLQEPYFITLETISTHTPYVHPLTGKKSESGVFQYADTAIDLFVKELEKNNFFENGVLFITADHHIMTETVTPAEVEKYGSEYKAAHTLPLIIISDALDLPKTIHGRFTQTDFHPSILSIVKDEYCTDFTQRSFIKPEPYDPNMAITISVDGFGYNAAKILYEDTYSIYRLIGNDSGYITIGLPPEIVGKMKDYITYQTVRQQVNNLKNIEQE